MICPYCGSFSPDDQPCCAACGGRLMPTAPAKKGRLWPPILVMLLMFAFGTAVYRHSIKNQPQPSDTPWFSISNGALYFDESKYTGAPELNIPSEIDGQTVTSISNNCFRYCDSLTTVILPDTLTNIGGGAFYDCEGLRGVKIPSSVEFIGDDAFFSCTSLEALSIPSSVSSIGENAFTNCSRLRHIFYDGSIEDFQILYPEEINPNVRIYMVDGSDPQDFYLP